MNEIYGVFWDYENVPLQSKNWKKFINSLDQFVRCHDIEYSKIYCKKHQIKSHYLEEIRRKLPKFKIHYTNKEGKNAVDDVLVQSFRNVLVDSHPKITHAIILSGDKDFEDILNDLENWDCKKTIIARKKSLNHKIKDKANNVHGVNELISNPNHWWKENAERYNRFKNKSHSGKKNKKKPYNKYKKQNIYERKRKTNHSNWGEDIDDMNASRLLF